jgi:hypothetical protein
MRLQQHTWHVTSLAGSDSDQDQGSRQAVGGQWTGSRQSLLFSALSPVGRLVAARAPVLGLAKVTMDGTTTPRYRAATAHCTARRDSSMRASRALPSPAAPAWLPICMRSASAALECSQ